VDAFGNAYVAGNAFSADFPMKKPLQGALSGPQDGFISKLNPTGTALLYSSYLGGTGYEFVEDLAVDRQGQVYIVGGTNSPDFPTFDALQPMPDTFVSSPFLDHSYLTVFNTECSGLVYSTYLGGHKRDDGHGMTVDAWGNVYVVGSTESVDFPTTPGAFQRDLRIQVRPPLADPDAFLIKIVNRRPASDDNEDR
jgi:hypothetical protein